MSHEIDEQCVDYKINELEQIMNDDKMLCLMTSENIVVANIFSM